MIRVTHVITGLRQGGAEAMLAKLCGEPRQRVRHSVICLGPPGPVSARISAAGVPLYHLGAELRTLPRAFAALMHAVRRERPQVLQGWMYHGNLAASAALLVAPGAAVAWNIRQTFYGLDREKPGTRAAIRLGRAWSRRVDRIVYNSHASASQHEAFGYSAGRRLILPNGFDVDRFRPDPEARVRVRRALRLPDSAFAVGCVARVHPMKGHELFLTAAVVACARDPDVHIVVAGAGTEDERWELRGRVEASGMADRFRFLGPVEDVGPLLNALDLLCVPSTWGEAFPNVLGEAMAVGLDVVAADVGDVAIVLGSRTQVFEPGDGTALLAKILEMREQHGRARAERGALARERIVTCYSLPRVVALYGDMYEQLADGGHRKE